MFKEFEKKKVNPHIKTVSTREFKERSCQKKKMTNTFLQLPSI